MHTPTLLIIAAILMGVLSILLLLMWRFNRAIPGLRWWALSYAFGLVASVGLLTRDGMHELVSVVLTQVAIGGTAYCCLAGAREYVGRRAISHGYAVVAIVVTVLVALYFTVITPHLGARFALAGLLPGVLYIASARVMARGGLAVVPARYLFAWMAGLHGVFLLLRPAWFQMGAGRMGMAGIAPDAELVDLISQFVLLEGIVMLVLVAFGALMLANEFSARELRQLADMDSLTHVFNRRAFLTLLDKAISQCGRSGSTLGVFVLDLDDFKRINDTWGHMVGDEVLNHFVSVVQRCLRKEDVVGRLGGEEFAVFLPGASEDVAHAAAQRLCRRVAQEKVATSAGAVHLTVSIGVTLAGPGDQSDAALQRADAAMYRAKQSGRNRVESLLPA